MEKTIYQLVQDFFHPQYQQPLNVRFVHCQPEMETADAQIQLKPCWGGSIVASQHRRAKLTSMTMENHHAINGKTHYFYGHFQ